MQTNAVCWCWVAAAWCYWQRPLLILVDKRAGGKSQVPAGASQGYVARTCSVILGGSVNSWAWLLSRVPRETHGEESHPSIRDVRKVVWKMHSMTNLETLLVALQCLSVHPVIRYASPIFISTMHLRDWSKSLLLRNRLYVLMMRECWFDRLTTTIPSISR